MVTEPHLLCFWVDLVYIYIYIYIYIYTYNSILLYYMILIYIYIYITFLHMYILGHCWFFFSLPYWILSSMGILFSQVAYLFLKVLLRFYCIFDLSLRFTNSSSSNSTWFYFINSILDKADLTLDLVQMLDTRSEREKY